MRPIGAAIAAAAVSVIVGGCSPGPTAQTSPSPKSPASILTTSSTPDSTPTAGLCPVPLCYGRVPTHQEEAAIVAVGIPAAEADLGVSITLDSPPKIAVGTNAARLFGAKSCQTVCDVSGCSVYLFEDSAGWHYLNAGCHQISGSDPSNFDHVFVAGCANVRDAPGLSANVVACLINAVVVNIDSAPVYLDGHIWWHLAGRGWMAHDFLLGPEQPCHC